MKIKVTYFWKGQAFGGEVGRHQAKLAENLVTSMNLGQGELCLLPPPLHHPSARFAVSDTIIQREISAPRRREDFA